MGLAAAINLDVVHSGIIKVSKVNPATLIGSGAVERIGGMVKEQEIGLVFVDYALSPSQQRNLEKAWNAKVIDRTGLILEIFGARARTKEGMLQVDLAALSAHKVEGVEPPGTPARRSWQYRRPVANVERQRRCC